jgi:hypothetical protein
MKKLLHAHPLYTILLVAYIFIHISSNTLWGNKNYVGIIETDGVGYYSYLPAIFIYQDLSFNFLDQASDHFARGAKEQIQVYSGHGIANKYFAGPSLFQLPFFVVAHVATKWEGGIADGYSKWYQILMSLCGIFYTVLGLYMMYKLLESYAIARVYLHVLILILAFGSSLMVYAVFEPCMSHAYSFYLINHALYLFRKQRLHFSPWRNVMLALLIGLIILVRPINVLFILSLFWIMESREDVWRYLKKSFSHYVSLCVSIILMLFVVGIQPLLYYLATGSAFLYSYSEEGFHWMNPEMINYLFSFRKGLFIYTPICFISLIAGLFIYKKKKYLLCSWVLFIGVLVYVLSAWWCWWYGGSFGQRSMIEFYFIFFIPLALALNELTGRYRTTLISLAALCSVICQIQIYQYRYYYIHYSDMDWEKYKKVFLRLDYIIQEIPPGVVFKE